MRDTVPAAIFDWTTSMEQSSFWEASGHSAGQEIPRLLWVPKVRYRVYNIIFPSTPRSSEWSPTLMFSD
jgi:hypothetical protein